MSDYKNIYKPSTMVEMITDLSLFLVEKYDDIPAKEWNATQELMMDLHASLVDVIGDETNERLMVAGADLRVIYNA